MKKAQIVIADYNSGSQTFCSKLNEMNNSRNIDLREVIRHEIREESEIGKEIKSCVDNGKRLDTELINKLVKSEVYKDQSDITIFNYPRTEEQYNALLKTVYIDKIWHLKLSNLDYFINHQFSKWDGDYALKYDITAETLKTKIINRQNEYQTIVDIMKKDFNCILVSIDYEKELSMIDYFIEKIKSA